MLDDERRRYIQAGIAVGALGSLAFFVSLLFLNEAQEAMIMFFGAIFTGTLMFALMNMSGFKSK